MFGHIGLTDNNETMKLYEHITDGGAEYYTAKPNDLKTVVCRTDGNELEIANFDHLKSLGFRSVVINEKRIVL